VSAERPGLKAGKPWQAARPGSAAARQDAADELLTIVAFDVPCDKARRKLGELCKDYGLHRAQWSVFEGKLTRNRREELSASIESLLASAPDGGRVAVYPIGGREAAWVSRIVTRGVRAKTLSARPLAVGAPPLVEPEDD